jgi:hypothetical protein
MIWLLFGIPSACFFFAALFKGPKGWFWAALIGLILIALLMIGLVVWGMNSDRSPPHPLKYHLGYALWGGLILAGYWLLGGVAGGCLGLIGRAARRAFAPKLPHGKGFKSPTVAGSG